MVPALFIDLQEDIKAFTIYDEINEYAIVINKNMDAHKREECYRIEKAKIDNGVYTSEIIRSMYCI